MPYVATRVGRLFVEVGGQGPAVLFWPSLLTDGGLWHAQARAAREGHRVLVVDGPSHGRSDPRRQPFTLDDCAEAVVEILDAFAVDRAVLVGLSWGGMTAMRVALRHPERVRGLALFDTSANAERPLAALRYRAMAEILRRFGLVRALDPSVASIMFSDRTLRERPELARELFRRLRGWDQEGLYHAVDAVVISRSSIAAELPRIAAPTIVGVGEDDRATSRGYAERIAASIPGAKLHVIAGAGHLSAIEAPGEVTRLLVSFLGELEAAAAAAQARA
jgi:3-oxoadipate enol-lactonase